MRNKRTRPALLLGCAGLAACAAAGQTPGIVELELPTVSLRDEGFRAQPPEPLLKAAFQPPKVEETRLPNGMRLIVAERHAVRLVSAELVMLGGSASLPGEAPAALSLIAGNAVHGTRSFTETQLFGEMNAHLIEIKPDVRDSWFGVSMRAPSPSLERGLQMIHAIMLEPTFPPQAFEIIRNQQIGYADLDAENVDLIARRNLYGALYGPSHPYTRAIAPRKGDLTRTTRDDVIRVWRETMDPSIATLVVVGDVDAGEVRRLVEGQFGAWQHDPSFPPRALVPGAAPGGPRLVVVDRPGAKQAKVLYGAVAPAAGSPDHPAHLLMRALIGGMRSSALATELRDEIGATSREGVDFADRPGVGLDWWYGSVAPERTADVLATLESTNARAAGTRSQLRRVIGRQGEARAVVPPPVRNGQSAPRDPGAGGRVRAAARLRQPSDCRRVRRLERGGPGSIPRPGRGQGGCSGRSRFPQAVTPRPRVGDDRCQRRRGPLRADTVAVIIHPEGGRAFPGDRAIAFRRSDSELLPTPPGLRGAAGSRAAHPGSDCRGRNARR